MAPKHNPTNGDLLKEIKEIRDDQKDMRADLNAVMDWKRGIEIGKAAVDEYKQQEERDIQRKLVNTETKTKTEVWKQAGYIATLLGAILYGIAASKGWL